MYYYSLYYIFWDELIGSRSGKKIRIRIQIRKTVTIPQQQCFRKVFAINMESVPVPVCPVWDKEESDFIHS